MSIDISSDIVVIGGGVSGVCAALAAARQGVEVCFITDRPVLGGNSSSEIRVWVRGASGGGNLLSEEMGILGELKLRNLHANPEFNVLFWDEVLLDAVLAEKKIRLFLNTYITKPRLEGSSIVSVQGFQMGSEKDFTFSASYFIDATGDGTIGAAAGVPFAVGSESRETYQEPNAPEKGNPYTMGNSLFYVSKKCDKPVAFVPPAYIYDIEKVTSFISAGGRLVNETLNGCDYWWFEFGGTVDTVQDNQDISLELRKITLGVWNYIKNSGLFDAENLTLEWVGSVPGKRESRRFIGAYVLKQQDLMEKRQFEDAVAYGGWYMDFHPAGGVYATEANCIQIPVFTYQIPLRCLYNQDFPNLLFAGRDISVSRAVFASSRDMDTCALEGQAAGTAAAYAFLNHCPPPRMSGTQIRAVKELLASQDSVFPGYVREAGGNLARQARISVSSVLAESDSDDDAGAFALSADWFLLFPKKRGASGVEVLTQSSQTQQLKVSVSKQSLPSRLAVDNEAETMRLEIAAGALWTAIPLPTSFTNYEGFVMLTGETVPGLSIMTSSIQNTGFLTGLRWSADYRYPRIRSDITGIYGPDNLQDGQSRPYILPRLWSSAAEKEPAILLEWEGPKEFRELVLYLNPDLNREIPSSIQCSLDAHHYFTPRPGMPPELVKDFRVEVRRDGKWSTAGRVSGNYQRRASFVFPTAASGDAVKIVIESTYGSPRAEVFEIEIY
ncbi:hypothetical protein AGMMS49546_04980 [Spirochaetia bacterium]|nr:hypothetical protein AGMMS49546_04980 [Spirochaetia bacterium]